VLAIKGFAGLVTFGGTAQNGQRHLLMLACLFKSVQQFGNTQIDQKLYDTIIIYLL
jgi:hypothetical protein